MIKSKVETLGKTTNDAVTHFAKEDVKTMKVYDDKQAEDESIEETAIDDLITKIGLWANILPPRK